MDLRRTFLPAIGAEEGAAALARVLTRSGSRVRGAGAAALAPGARLFQPTEIVEAGGVTAWMFDETTAEPDVWDPLLTRDLSAETGGFAVSVDASRGLGQAGCAVFFAGRTLAFLSENLGEAPSAIGFAPDRGMAMPASQRVHAAFVGFYTQLTGLPYPAPDAGRRLAPVTATGCHRASSWRPRAGDERPLALAVFPLVAADEFAAAWDTVEAAVATAWRWRPARTLPAGIPYIVLTREGQLDMALCDALTRRLDVPAAAIGLNEPGAEFDWWRAQPGQVAQHGASLGAAAFVHRLMPALSALGERPGILTVREPPGA